MGMRVSTLNSFDAGVGTLQRRQVQLAESQEQLTSGKRVQRASDDPSAAARAERAIAAIARTDTARRAVGASDTLMRESEGALGDAVALLQSARETMVAAGNAGFSDAERRGLAEKLRAVRAQLFDVANRSDGAGTWVFGGQGAGTPPFVDAPGGVQYVATPGVLTTAEGMQLSADGRAAWMSAPTGNGVFETRADAGVRGAWIGPGQVTDPAALTGDAYRLQFSVDAAGVTTYAVLRNGAPTAVTAAPYVSGQSIAVDGMAVQVTGVPAAGDGFDLVPSTASNNVFAVIDAAAGALETSGRSGPQVAQTVSDALRDLDGVLTTMQSQRTVVGEALVRVDTETSRLDAQEIRARTERSNAEDLDMVEALSEFQLRQTGYDAALKSYSMVQRLSLFDYLGR
jgi:flagellar hook-associated protein 3 FlgL